MENNHNKEGVGETRGRRGGEAMDREEDEGELVPD